MDDLDRSSLLDSVTVTTATITGYICYNHSIHYSNLLQCPLHPLLQHPLQEHLTFATTPATIICFQKPLFLYLTITSSLTASLTFALSSPPAFKREKLETKRIDNRSERLLAASPLVQPSFADEASEQIGKEGHLFQKRN